MSDDVEDMGAMGEGEGEGPDELDMARWVASMLGMMPEDAGERKLLGQQRPDTDEFWRMSRLVCELDARCDEDTGAADDAIAERTDQRSLAYMADQRALRMLAMHGMAGSMTALTENIRAMLGSMWMDGWMNGHDYAGQADKWPTDTNRPQ